MDVTGKAIGDCIHCYEYRGMRLCSLNDMICDEDDECHCVNFTARDNEGV